MNDVKQRNRRRRQRKRSQNHKRKCVGDQRSCSYVDSYGVSNSMTLKAKNRGVSGAGDGIKRADPGGTGSEKKEIKEAGKIRIGTDKCRRCSERRSWVWYMTTRLFLNRNKTIKDE